MSKFKHFNLDKTSMDSGISCIKIIYYEDLNLVATGDWEGQICFYNVKNQNIVYKLITPNQDSVTFLNFSNEIETIFIGTGFGFLYLINIKQIYQDIKLLQQNSSGYNNYMRNVNNNIIGDPKCFYFFGKHELMINGIFHLDLKRHINSLAYGGSSYNNYNNNYGGYNNYNNYTNNNYNNNNYNNNNRQKIEIEVIKHINWTHIAATTAVDGITSFWDLIIPNNNANQNLILSLNTNNSNLLKIVCSDANNDVLINALSGAFIEIYDISQLPIVIYNKITNNTQSITELKPSVTFSSGFLKDIGCVKLFKPEYNKGFVVSGISQVIHFEFSLNEIFTLKVNNKLELLPDYSDKMSPRLISPKEFSITTMNTKSTKSIFSDKNNLLSNLSITTHSTNRNGVRTSKEVVNVILEGLSVVTAKDRYYLGLNSNHMILFKVGRLRDNEDTTEITAYDTKEDVILSCLDISPDEKTIIGCFTNDFYFGELGFDECSTQSKLVILAER